MYRWTGLNLGSLYMQFQQDWPKDKKYSSLNFLQENLEKFRSTELYDAPLEGSKVRATRAKYGRPVQSTGITASSYIYIYEPAHAKRA